MQLFQQFLQFAPRSPGDGLGGLGIVVIFFQNESQLREPVPLGHLLVEFHFQQEVLGRFVFEIFGQRLVIVFSFRQQPSIVA